MRTSLKIGVSMRLLGSGVVAQNRQGRLPELPPPKLYRLEELQHVARANVIAILGGTLVDGTGVPPLAKSAIVVRGNRIVQVGKEAKSRSRLTPCESGQMAKPSCRVLSICMSTSIKGTICICFWRLV